MSELTEKFQKNSQKRSRLAEILADPVWKEAIEAVEDELKPRGDLRIFLESETVSAHRYHQFAGLTYLSDALKRLSATPAKAVQLKGKRLSTAADLKENK